MDNPLLPFVVDRLRRLQGLSFRELSESAAISSPSNLREWVMGLPARLSAVRVDRVLTAAGLDPATGMLRPGLHRWKISKEELGVLKEVLPLLFPDRLEAARARSSGSIRHQTWTLLVRGAVHVLISFDEHVEVEFQDIFNPVLASSEGTATLPPERSLTDLEISTLSRSDLSPQMLEPLFGRPSNREFAWTFELLFERMWAEGIEPTEAARRLGFY